LEAKTWVDEYYSIIKSEECVPIGWAVNPNICMVSSFSCHQDRATAVSRGLDGFEFFGFALGSLYGFGEHKPGRTNLWENFQKMKASQKSDIDMVNSLTGARGGIGTPDDLRNHMNKFEQAGVDQVTFIQQAGMNKHEHILESLELFAAEVMGEFKAREAEREAKKMEELAPWIEKALARKVRMKALADDEIPTFMALGRRITEESKNAQSIYEKPAIAAGK
jgi:hypothetical protein